MVNARSRIVAGTILALVLAACSNRSASRGTSTAGGNGSTADQGSVGVSSGATVSATNGDLGRMLVDANGRTLYLFLSDNGGASTCYGDCAANWPALTVNGKASAGDGVDASLLGTAERKDGSTQVTYAGHPLYTFAGDTAAGQTNGEGIGNTWFAVSPQGTPLKGGGGGYGKY